MTNPGTHNRCLAISKCPWLIVCAVASALVLVASSPAAAQTFTVLHNFTGGAGGAAPYAGVLIGRDGNLYGTTAAGGGGTCNDYYYFEPGCGTVYELNPSSQSFITLWQFSGGSDGAYPEAGLVVGSGGAMYGSTGFGGNGCVGGCGTMFRLTPPVTPPRTIKQAGWTVTILHSFNGNDGEEPTGDLAVDGSGNVYGSTRQGGPGTAGTAFKLSNLNGLWTLSDLHDFEGYDNFAVGGVVLDAAGNVYGTSQGGAFGAGSVYQLLVDSDWQLNTLYSFTPYGDNGDDPVSGITLDSSGNVYGSTAADGVGHGGTVFELSSGSWSFNLLDSFVGGGGPYYSNLIFDKAGNLYGTTNADGANGYGSVFKLTPSHGTWTYTSLHDFAGGSDGGLPIGTLALDANGNLYGTASRGGNDLSKCSGWGCGVVFKITP